nr:YkgJ family cysteine cluster protein [Dissulfurirhabdus thermomarina]
MLADYLALRGRVDALCRRIRERYGRFIACRRGCHDCCTELSVFPVEAAALADAFARMPPGPAREAVAAAGPGGCPLLVDGACALYEARPVICRTQGLPLLLDDAPSEAGAAPAVAFCPRNFRGVTDLAGDAVISLRRLNTALAAVNLRFAARCRPGRPFPDRIGIRSALRFRCAGGAGP